MVFLCGAVFFCFFMPTFSFLSVNGLLYSQLSCFFLFIYFLRSVSMWGPLDISLQWYAKLSINLLCCVIIFPPFFNRNTILGLQFPLILKIFSYNFLVGLLAFIQFTKLYHVQFLAFMTILCLMALLCWNDLRLVSFVGSRLCFLYSALTIFSFFQNLHITMPLVVFSLFLRKLQGQYFCCL